MAAAGGGACSPRGAHAAPGCPEAWSGCLPPALLPPLPLPLAPSSLPFTPGAWYESFEWFLAFVFLLYLNVPVTVLYFLCSV